MPKFWPPRYGIPEPTAPTLVGQLVQPFPGNQNHRPCYPSRHELPVRAARAKSRGRGFRDGKRFLNDDLKRRGFPERRNRPPARVSFSARL